MRVRTVLKQKISTQTLRYYQLIWEFQGIFWSYTRFGWEYWRICSFISTRIWNFNNIFIVMEEVTTFSKNYLHIDQHFFFLICTMTSESTFYLGVSFAKSLEKSTFTSIIVSITVVLFFLLYVLWMAFILMLALLNISSCIPCNWILLDAFHFLLRFWSSNISWTWRDMFSAAYNNFMMYMRGVFLNSYWIITFLKGGLLISKHAFVYV